MDFGNKKFREKLKKLFLKSVKEDYSCFWDNIGDMFYPETNMRQNYLEIDDEKLKEHIVEKIKTAKADENISPYGDITLLDLTKNILSSILWDTLGNMMYLIICECHTPLSYIKMITDIEMIGVVSNFKKNEYNEIREKLAIDKFVPDVK